MADERNVNDVADSIDDGTADYEAYVGSLSENERFRVVNSRNVNYVDGKETFDDSFKTLDKSQSIYGIKFDLNLINKVPGLSTGEFELIEDYKSKVAVLYNRSSYFRLIWNKTLHYDANAYEDAESIIRYLVTILGTDIEAIKKAYACSPFGKNECSGVDEADVDSIIDDAIKYVETYGTIFVVKDTDIDLIKNMPENDYSNAKLFLKCSDEEVKYIPADSSWRVFNGKYWRILSDSTYNVNQRCQAMYERLYWSVKDLPKATSFRKRVIALGNQRTVKNLVEQLKLMVEVQESKFNAYPHLLASNNGVINLRTGQLEEAKKNQYLTSYVNLDYNSDVPAPRRFIQFINEIFDGDEALINYVHKMLGYCITGESKEQALFWFNGRASNGKSLLVKVINSIFGDLCSTITSEALAKKGSQSEINTSLYQAKNARMVFSSENEADMSFNFSLIKQITGEDPIKVRTLFKTPIEFKAKFKMLFVSNPRLNLGYEQDAMRRRIKVIPFNVTFDDVQERTVIDGRTHLPKDLDLYGKLMAERESILKWFVDGAVKWYCEGLGEEPDACKEAYNQYCQANQRKQIAKKDGSTMFDDENSATGYIINNLDFTGRFEDIVQSTEVYEAYQQQCEQTDEEAVTQTAFGRLMNDVQGVSNKKGAGGLKFYHGVKFKADEE